MERRREKHYKEQMGIRGEKEFKRKSILSYFFKAVYGEPLLALVGNGRRNIRGVMILKFYQPSSVA